MNHKRPPLPAIFLIVLVIGFSVYFIFTQTAEEKNGMVVTASGTIEATQINVAPELAGKVKDVLADEGQSVKAGDPLLSIDDSLLTAQRAVASAQIDSAKAALDTAQAAYATGQQHYNAALANALAQEQSSRSAVWHTTKPGEFEQPVWYFSKGERMKAAQAEADATGRKLESALKRLEEVRNSAGSGQFLEIEAALAQARISFQNAKAVYDSTAGASDSRTLRDAAQTILEDAELALDEAQQRYEDALETDAAQDVLEARASVMIAQEIYDSAVDNLRALQTGTDSQAVITAARTLDQARAALGQAQAAVNTAEASLALIDTQIAKLAVHAPMDGIVLTRNVEPGEFVQAGAAALTMANLDELTITVYVPEDRYGQISLGQQAQVTVDSFPGQTFSAGVIHIADQAEFTPRNVQTVEGRSSTVYAIKLKVTDSESKLKIGMPADVVFK
jgi:HlyD family secretion protein